VNQVTACSEKTRRDSSSSDDAYVYVVNSDACVKQPQTHVKLNGVRVGVIIDSAVNMVSEEVFNTLKPKPRLSTAKIKMFSYGSENALPIIGTFTCNVQATHKNTESMFYVFQR